MTVRIIRGVRVATPRGIEPAAVYLEGRRIVAITGYEEIPRQAKAQELGKSVLMPGLIAKIHPDLSPEQALQGGITTLLTGAAPQADVQASNQSLSSQWTRMRDLDQSLELLVDTLCRQPAIASGLEKSKGCIDVGFDADLVIWNPEYTVTGSRPLLYGLVRQVIVAGRERVREGRLLDHEQE